MFYGKNGFMGTNLSSACVTSQENKRVSGEVKCSMFSYFNSRFRDFVLALQAYAVLCPHLCLQPYSFPYVRVSACADNTTKSVLSPRIMFSMAHRASPRAWLPNKKDFMVSCASASRKREVHDWQQEKG